MQDQTKLDAYGEFGRTFGVLVQVLDDLDDLNLLQQSVAVRDLSKINRSLPIVYAMQVIPQPQRLQLQTNLHLAEHEPRIGQEVFAFVEETGAVFFLMTEIKRLREQALKNLADSGATGPAFDILASLITGLGAFSTE